jgi:hypothetical protein
MSALLLACGLGWVLPSPATGGGEGKKGKVNGLLIVDGAGKEVPLSTWKFLHGTRRLSWLAPAPKAKPKEAKGADEGGEDEPPPGRRRWSCARRTRPGSRTAFSRWSR